MNKIISPELFPNIIPINTTKAAASMALVNKSIHALIDLPMWRKIASEITGYDAQKYEMREIKLLICPWLSLPMHLPFKIPRHPLSSTQMIGLEGNDRLLLSIEYWREHLVYEMPCKPTGDSFEYQYVEKRLQPQASIALATIPEAFDTQIPEKRQYTQYPVHKGVYALMEFFSNQDMNGLYFFTTTDQRMLRHINLPGRANTAHMCTRPMEMWIMVDPSIYYFGHDNGPTHLATPSERVDPALWHALFRRPNEAIEYLQNSRIDINTTSLVGKYTVLHYAAMSGDVETIRTLIEAKADPTAIDHLNETPLGKAVRFKRTDAECFFVVDLFKWSR
jgi:hypothetical protein